MPESNIDITLRTRKEGDAPAETTESLKAMKGGLTDLEKAVSGTRTTLFSLDSDIQVFGQNVGTAADFLSGMGISIPISPLQLLGSAVQSAGQIVKESVADYADYVEQVSKLAAFANTSTEEISKLVQITDDLRISSGDLEMALKTMTTKGFTPTVDGLAEMARQYNGLQTPLERSQFLVENFGRAGQEMGRLMELGAEGIQSAADEVANWMLVTGDSEAQVNEYLLALDAMDESWMSIKYQIGQAVIPVFTDIMNIMSEFQNTINEHNDGWLYAIPLLGTVVDLVYAIQAAFKVLKKDADDATDSIQDANAAVSTFNSNAARGNLTDRGNYGNLSDGPRYMYYGNNRAEGGAVYPGETFKIGERGVEWVQFEGMGAVSPQAPAQPAVTVVYAPTISTLDKTEAESVLLPLIKSAMRRM